MVSKADRLESHLAQMGACPDALNWIEDELLWPTAGLIEAWNACPRQNWLEWLLAEWGIVTAGDLCQYYPCGSREQVRADFRDDIACIAFYTGL